MSTNYYESKSYVEIKYWTFGLLTALLIMVSSGYACNTLDKRHQSDMASKGLCYIPVAGQDVNTYVPCSGATK